MRALCIYVVLIGAAGCVLPGYDENAAPAKITKNHKPDGGTDGGTDAGMDDGGMVEFSGPACGLSNKLPRSCDACIRKSCCDLAKECSAGSACSKDMLERITPAADFSSDFDKLLGCMQEKCDDACKVNWGCVDNYSWPEPKDDLNVDVTVVDFAAVPDKPISGVDVQACQAIDPACTTGKVTSGKTSKSGTVALTLPPEFNGFFSFDGGGYLESTVLWTEPVYRTAGFKQLQLTADALEALAVITGEHKSSSDKFDPAAGHLIFRAQNCLPLRYVDRPTPPHAQQEDVVFSFEPKGGASRVFYTEPNGGVSVTLKATTRDGVGGAFEAPATNISVHAVDTHSGKEFASGSVRVRAGAIGYAYFVPRSSQ